ncbi:MAG: ABC transporter ATP-binding protein, partial [Armatimonadota bacterium]|nr:ABC transporter ATP-binding protein [Armatimonadota bacterium]
MIEARELTKYYGTKLAIHNVTFQVEKGEILGLLGPNAAGKTTTMRIITAYMPPTSGTAKVAGYDVLEQSLEVRRRIGYLPENVPLYHDLTVRQYLEFVAKVKGVDGRERDHHVDEIMDRVNVLDRADSLIGKLSKGYRQRVGLAQALVGNPPVLILDEPTSGLDPRQVIEVRQLIKELASEHTVILSTHILPEVSMTCQRVVIISDGTVVAEDTPEGLARRLAGSERITVHVRGPADQVRRALESLPGVLAVRDGGRVTNTVHACALESKVGSDVRGRVAQVVVGNGWG